MSKLTGRDDLYDARPSVPEHVVFGRTLRTSKFDKIHKNACAELTKIACYFRNLKFQSAKSACGIPELEYKSEQNSSISMTRGLPEGSQRARQYCQ